MAHPDDRSTSAPARKRWQAGALTLAAVISLVACGDDSDADDEERVGGRVPELPEVEGPITGPGAMYVDPLEQNFEVTKEDHGYVSEEHFVSGIADGESYTVRVMVTRPGDEADVAFSGHAIVEAMHATGIPFVWNFTREYLMAEGHAAVEISIFPETVEGHLQGGDEEGRYAALHVAEDVAAHQDDDEDAAGAADIYAQVGLLLKSDDTPLEGVEHLHMTGHSMAVGPVWHYMDTHHDAYRLDNGDPIYDGFFPETTRTASRKGPFPEVDVPTVLINSELEVEAVIVEDGIDYRRPDSDDPGDQFRLYEVAGMPHNPAWMHPLLQTLGIEDEAAETCENPQLNSFPYEPTVAMALDHLMRWVADDVAPPRAEPIELTGDIDAADGRPEIARDEHGNAVGGVRSTTLDVPVATYLGSNSPEALVAGSCEVYGSQEDFPAERFDDLYGDGASYVDQVDQRLDELIADGWFLDMFADELRDEARDRAATLPSAADG